MADFPYRVGFVPFDQDRSEKTGSSRIRVTNVVANEPKFEIFKAGQRYDAVVFQKYYWHDYAQLFQGVKILDVCDPDWLSGSDKVDFVRMCSLMDGLVANTEATAAYLRKLTGKPVAVIQDRHDMRLFKQEAQHRGKAKSCVWFGYAHNASVLKQYVVKLQEHGLKLTVMSNEYKPVGGPDFADQESYVKWPETIEAVNTELVKHDFALLPKPRKLQDQYKSDNKATHAWAVGLPVAFWGDDVDRLISAEEREKEKAEKMAQTRKDYDCRLSTQEYRDFVSQLLAEKELSTQALQ